ncbi:Ribonucleoprotein LSM domain eukaryotic/archaea-type [Penicillium verhagenii]|nr:Ribonucleoprotein LSM domain eukaryotic/archaea-type [Penicillium verhagenii]
MSLKRKASFSAAPSSPFVPMSCELDMVDSSKHLHSRTRKRFRDGRPDDEVVYEKTLRWIFSAQKQPSAVPMDTSEEMMQELEASSFPSSETADPRQHTLLRFFQPRTQPVPHFKPSREALVPRANETLMAQDEALRRTAFQQMPTGAGSSGSETMSTGFNQMDTDMDMDTDESSEGSNLSANVGVTSWM